MTSRPATVLVIFVIAIVAFCLASVCGAMTGTISILPNGTDNGPVILDNLSAITDGTGDSGKSYGNEHQDYSSSSDSKSDSKVETTTDDSSSSSSDHTEQSTDNKDQSDKDSKSSSDTPAPSPAPAQDSTQKVETTVG